MITDEGGNDFHQTSSPFGTTLGTDTIWDLPINAACLE